MKLSIVIICWNDWKVIENCLKSIYAETNGLPFEVIVSDNGSTDGSIEKIRRQFPDATVIENGANLGFAKGNNAGIRAATGEYVLILNPDTIILNGALQKLIAYADTHPEAGAFGCRVSNPDGSYQISSRPLPTVSNYFVGALGLRFLEHLSTSLTDVYTGWHGETEREIGFHSGCCILVREDLLNRLEGLDERFFYHFEEVDLCYRIWKSGFSILYYPKAEIIHLGGQSVGRFPIKFRLETFRSRYRYYYKHFGERGLRQIRRVSILSLGCRYLLYGAISIFKPSESMKNRLECYRVLLRWNWKIDPLRFVQDGTEPESGYAPLTPAFLPGKTMLQNSQSK